MHLLHATDIPLIKAYSSVCQQAADSDLVFSQFKRNPNYTAFVEHLSYLDGINYLKVIKEEYPDLLKRTDQFRQNDLYGNPQVFNYKEIGKFSPTTLRYVKVAGDLKREFGANLSNMHIVEIGGGYGGQCKILADICDFASYTLIDLPACNALSKKYLELMGIKNVHFIDNTAIHDIGQYDLVISNFAFSEFSPQEQIVYWENVIQPTPNGYMTLNFPHIWPETFTLDDMLAKLLASARQGKIEPEIPQTGGDNQLMLWKSTMESTAIKHSLIAQGNPELNSLMDWNGPLFHKALINRLNQQEPIDDYALSQKGVTIALHIPGGDFFSPGYNLNNDNLLEFPPVDYYTMQLKRLSEIFTDTQLFIYILTKNPNIEQITTTFAKALLNPKMTFGWKVHVPVPTIDITRLINEAFFMAKFDCFIRTESNFSKLVEILGAHQVVITPKHFTTTANGPTIDQVTIKFRGP